MPNFQDLFKSDVTRGAALGVGAAIVAVAAIPAIVVATRPIARIALKSGLILLEKSREALAEAGENIEDLVAEVRAELAAEREGFSATVAETVKDATEAEG